MLFSLKTDLPFLAQLPRSSSFSFLLILLRAWNLEQWGHRWPKAPQWWQTMCLCLLGFLERHLATWFCSLYNLWHWGLIWSITPQWWQVGINLNPSKALGWDLNRGFDLTAFFSTVWFLLCGGMYTDFTGSHSSNPRFTFHETLILNNRSVWIRKGFYGWVFALLVLDLILSIFVRPFMHWISYLHAFCASCIYLYALLLFFILLSCFSFVWVKNPKPHKKWKIQKVWSYMFEHISHVSLA